MSATEQHVLEDFDTKRSSKRYAEACAKKLQVSKAICSCELSGHGTATEHGCVLISAVSLDCQLSMRFSRSLSGFLSQRSTIRRAVCVHGCPSYITSNAGNAAASCLSVGNRLKCSCCRHCMDLSHPLNDIRPGWRASPGDRHHRPALSPLRRLRQVHGELLRQ